MSVEDKEEMRMQTVETNKYKRQQLIRSPQIPWFEINGLRGMEFSIDFFWSQCNINRSYELNR